MRLCKLQKATYAPQYPTTGFSCAARSSKPALVAISILITELARTAGLTAGAYETEAALSIIRVSSKGKLRAWSRAWMYTYLRAPHTYIWAPRKGRNEIDLRWFDLYHRYDKIRYDQIS